MSLMRLVGRKRRSREKERTRAIRALQGEVCAARWTHLSDGRHGHMSRLRSPRQARYLRIRGRTSAKGSEAVTAPTAFSLGLSVRLAVPAKREEGGTNRRAQSRD